MRRSGGTIRALLRLILLLKADDDSIVTKWYAYAVLFLPCYFLIFFVFFLFATILGYLFGPKFQDTLMLILLFMPLPAFILSPIVAHILLKKFKGLTGLIRRILLFTTVAGLIFGFTTLILLIITSLLGFQTPEVQRGIIWISLAISTIAAYIFIKKNLPPIQSNKNIQEKENRKKTSLIFVVIGMVLIVLGILLNG